MFFSYIFFKTITSIICKLLAYLHVFTQPDVILTLLFSFKIVSFELFFLFFIFTSLCPVVISLTSTKWLLLLFIAVLSFSWFSFSFNFSQVSPSAFAKWSSTETISNFKKVLQIFKLNSLYYYAESRSKSQFNNTIKTKTIIK